MTGSSPDWRSRILRRFEGSKPQHELADWRLLGVDSERSQRLQKHFPADPVPAAVLVPLVDHAGGLTVLLTQRATHLAKPIRGFASEIHRPMNSAACSG